MFDSAVIEVVWDNYRKRVFQQGLTLSMSLSLLSKDVFNVQQQFVFTVNPPEINLPFLCLKRQAAETQGFRSCLLCCKTSLAARFSMK